MRNWLSFRELLIRGLASCVVTMAIACGDTDGDAMPGDGGGSADSASSPDGATNDVGSNDGSSGGPLELQGEPGDVVAGAIPDAVFAPDPERYDAETGVSFDTFGVGFQEEITVAEASALIDAWGSEIVGGYRGVAGEAGGLLVLRANTDSASELEALVESVNAEPSVEAAAADQTLSPLLRRPGASGMLQPGCDDTSALGWSYDGVGDSATWGLELMRAPQMWNLVGALEKANTEKIRVAVIDSGFENHEDVPYTWDGDEDAHGTSVAGIIGARWDNVGIDGVSPLVELLLVDGFTWMSTYTKLFIEVADEVEVANLSLGVPAGPNHGQLTFRLLSAYQARQGRLPVLVQAAGNDSDLQADVREPARTTSGLAWAGSDLGAANVANIEALRLSVLDFRTPTLANFSNVDGHFSAPGERVGAPSGVSSYCRVSGSSFAAPMVTGLVAFMLAAEPRFRGELKTTLTVSPVLDALRRSAYEIEDGTSNAVDGFAALMELDELSTNHRILRMLVDIDDGTVDGNTRVDPASSAVYLEEDADGDGGRGDGNVDMSDFRRFRDWLIDDLGLGAFDGAADHPKRDQNLDTEIGGTTQDRYSLGDFNGDGQIDGTEEAYVGGSFDRGMNDLQMLAEVFDDPHYDVSELEALLDGGDITVDLQRCFSMPAVSEIELEVRPRAGGAAVKTIRVQPDTVGNRHVLTVPMDDYDISVRTLDAGGEMLHAFDAQAAIQSRCEDVFIAPTCTEGSNPNEGMLYDATFVDSEMILGGASDINNAGQVLGGDFWLYTPGSGTMQLPSAGRPYYLSDSGAVVYPDIPQLPGTTSLTWTAISNNGVFAGLATDGPAVEKGYVYDGSVSEIMADAAVDWSILDVNDSGTVVGIADGRPADLTGPTPTFLPLPAGAMGGQASFINNTGWIFGASNITGVGVFPTLWRGSGPEVFMDDGIEQFVAMNDAGTLVAICPSSTCVKVSLDGETLFEIERNYDIVVDDDSNRDPYIVNGVVDINDSGVILAFGRPSGGGSPVSLRLSPIGTSRILMRAETILLTNRVRYRVFVRNTGLDTVTGLQLTIDLSTPSESTLPLPDECVPNDAGGGLLDHVTCVWPDTQSIAPEAEELYTFDFRPNTAGELAADIEASMLSPTGTPTNYRRVYRTLVP